MFDPAPWRWRCFVALVLYCCSACDHGLDAGPSGAMGIAGRLTFAGQWPANVGQVAVAVYRETPQQLTDFLALVGTDTEVELGAEVYDYFVPIEVEGEYQWVVVAWRLQDNFWDFRSLLGCYHAPGDTRPTTVVVRRGEVAGDVDIAIDFEVLQSENLPTLCVQSIPPELLEQGSGK